MGTLGEALLTVLETKGDPRAKHVGEIVQNQLKREEKSCTSGRLIIPCTRQEERKPLSPTASRILQDIVPWAIDQLRQNPSAGKCGQLIEKLRDQSRRAGKVKSTALRHAAEDLDTLRIIIEMAGGKAEECRAAVESHKWRRLLPFLHTVT